MPAPVLFYYTPKNFAFQVITSESPAALLIAVNVILWAVFAAVVVALVPESLTMTASVMAELVATPAPQVVLYWPLTPRPAPRLTVVGKVASKATFDAVR